MIYISVISALLAVIFLIRYYLVKKEMKSITKQLENYNYHNTEKKVDITFFDKDIEALSVGVNRQIDLIVQANADKRRTEMELKQAVANISHDIRTPLTSIFGYIQLLEAKDVTPEEREEYVAIIKDRTKRLQVLLNDFFELSIIESVDHYLKLETIKMNNVVSEVLMEFYDQFTERDLKPIIMLPKEKISIIADESAVKRVMENLINNAIKHASGNVSISLVQGDSKVIMTISNDANQLDRNDLDMLFNRFYTADQTRSSQGTGLGLSIAKGLMQKMNGNLIAEYKESKLIMKCEWKMQ
ncbi:two-component sensor histidine kinase [Virgibacillus phasianinus]|uniref:histidine kinase n=1 Tax=Virgibacillus phasianinus TaxID=2017483 RepID=A0A220U7X3_9BACI|nr:HAMP domain-containing sensor histidine kinase [Virgibacillus phasianinus]ASK64200.1 two-component sensor histidine kinase [Virgibacillus phasianinus]